ncbi:MAG: hypothetical protein ISN28_06215 [Ectothiorhodospiraceae bacterium AqS1]|nr:hypothetical protein [Ectothiorhodospiraceae bacterium AqS1]
MAKSDDKIEVENVNVPGMIVRVDRGKYSAMRKALLEVMPKGLPGISAAEAKARLLPLLPEDIFPRGEKAGWWSKTVQLDLEAKGLLRRAQTKPLTFYRP